MRSTFRITFYVNRNKEKNGQVPVLGRITINGSIAQFSCKQSISPKLWNAKSNRATGKSDPALRLNRGLDNIRIQITKHYQQLTDKQSYVTAEIVRNAWQGIGTESDTLLGAFDKHNQEFAKRTDKDRSASTYGKYLTVRRHVAGFIQSEYKRNDLHLKEIGENFIKGFCLYLAHTLSFSSSTAWLYCIPLKMIVTKAHNNGTISTNPFAYHRISQESKERGYLTEGELKILIAHKFEDRRLDIVRDIFVFAALTGLSYIDIKNLTKDKIVTMLDGSKWIKSSRKKTQTPFSVKLLDIPLRIIEKYDFFRTNDNLLPVPKNSDCNLRLKQIAKMCGIDKRVNFHQRRHTFATTVTYANGVSIESISKMLGHTKISTTQIYARIVDKTVSNEMDKLAEKLSDTKFCAGL